MELNNEENKTSQDINVEQTNANVDQQNNSSPKEENNKKGNKNILDIIIIVLCIITIVMLLMYIRKPDASIEELVKTPTVISQYKSDSFLRKPVSTTEACDENDRYYANNLEYTYKCFFNDEEVEYKEYLGIDIYGVKVQYAQISGLKDSQVESKINERIEEISNKLLENAKKVGKDPVIEINAYPMFNCANLLTIDYYASAGTYEPIWAINTISAVCLIYVDLPAILGPVIIDTLLSPLSKYVSFEIKLLSLITFSTTGWRPPFISIIPFSFIFGLT